ncbi:MAG: protein-L-isoaspartate(D-aspartate) O-methyltransferase [Thermodesulfovibrionales bacterium]
MRIVLLVLLAGILVTGSATNEESGDLVRRREAMIAEIQADAHLAHDALGRPSIDVRVEQALRDVPRHEFVPESLRGIAYLKQPLPSGYGQTISQPYIVALMTDLLMVDDGDTVLEIGTGSGYQAAVLSKIAKKVYSVEIIKELAESARDRLRKLGYGNVEVVTGDGYYGLEKHAPFDAIMVTAAAGHVPTPLIRQLKAGGRIVIPIGGAYQLQMLTIVRKEPSGILRTRQVLPVSFVPMTGRVLGSE